MAIAEEKIDRAIANIADRFRVHDRVALALLKLAAQTGYHIRWEEQCDQEYQQSKQKTAKMLAQLNDAIEKWRPNLMASMK